MKLNIEAKFSKSLLKRNNAVGITHGVSQSDRKDAVKHFMITKAKYKQELFKHMELLLGGKLTKEQYEVLQKTTISKHFTNSYLLGKKFNQRTETTLSDSERRFIVYQTTEEMKYMSKFADDMINMSGKMPYKRRMNMYAGGLDPLFKLGDIAYLPEDMQIEWILGITDKHCIDCLMFAKNSPYTKKTLPGIPRSCNSRCLNNCKCKLQYYTSYVNTAYTNFIIDNYTSAREIIPSENDYNYIKNQVDSYYNNRLKYEMTKLDKYFDIAKENKKNVSNYINGRNLAVSVIMYNATQIGEVKKFKKSDEFDYIENTTNITPNDIVSVFVGGKQVYGKVKAIDGNLLSVETLFDSAMQVDVSIHVVFKESK